MNITDEFNSIVGALQDADIDFALCGGLAMALHGFPRFTRDIDLLVRPEVLAKTLDIANRCGFDDEPELLVLGQQAGRRCEIWRVNKFRGEDHLTLDLILVNEILEDVWQGRSPFSWQGKSLTIVSSVGLAKMKRLASRPQDLADIQRLGFALDDPAIQP